MSNKTTKQQSKFTRSIKAPIRILTRARDSYVRSMTNFSTRMNHGSVVNCPIRPVNNILPKSFSVNSSRSNNNDDDLRELVRAASQRELRDKLGNDIYIQRYEQPPKKLSGLPRSLTAGMGRIDEDEPCDFKEDLKVKIGFMYPRSKSYSVSKKKSFESWKQTTIAASN